MEKYILKSALAEEIENKRKYAQTLGDNAINESMQQFYDGMKQGCVDILSFLDALKVKEVDLDKEYKDFVKEDPVYNKLVNGIVGKAIARHFFELGFKAQKGEEPVDLKKVAIKEWKSYGYYLFDTPLEVCQCLSNLRDEELINIIYSGKYIVFYARTIDPFSGTSKETSIISR